MNDFAHSYGYRLLGGFVRHPVLLLLLPYIGGLISGIPGFIGVILIVALLTPGPSKTLDIGLIKGFFIILMAGTGVLAGCLSLHDSSSASIPEGGLAVLEGVVTDGPWPVSVFGTRSRLLFVRDGTGIDYRVTVEGVPKNELVTGDRIRVRGRLNSRGPALFVHTRAGLAVRIPYAKRNTLDRIIYLYRKKLWERLNATLDRRLAGVAATMLLGIPGQIDVRTRSLFRKTGTAHLLAISGLHMGLITLMSTWCLARLGIGSGSRIWLLIPMLGLFCLMTGCKIPVARAYFVCVFYLVLMKANRQVDPMDPLFNACLVLLILDPNALVELSFQLSFAGYFAILVYLKLGHIPHRKSRGDETEIKDGSFLRPRFIADPLWKLPAITMRTLKKAGLLFGVSMASWLGTLPLTLHYFQLFVPLAPLINVVVFPLFLMSLTATAIHTLALSLDLGGSLITQMPAEITISLLCRVLEGLSRLWPGALDAPPISPAIMVACYVSAIVGLTALSSHGGRATPIIGEDRYQAFSRST